MVAKVIRLIAKNAKRNIPLGINALEFANVLSTGLFI
jgi:hypothetical protein